ncbi:hypothetical protein CRUP_030310, partial [Coryphaenoides rupestris]
MDSSTLDVDGSVMEGGGQILRVSAALSCITGTVVKISKIRAGRSTPGLRLDGAIIGSTEISLAPGKITSGNHLADPQTAGSVGLLLQVSLPCALFANAATQLCLKGGTNAEMAPQIDYTVKIFKPIVEKFGVNFDCDIKMRGYYPKGGGEVLLAKDMSTAAVRTIRREIKDLYINIPSIQEKDQACGNGNGIIIIAESSTGCLFAGSALGKKGVYADKVGIEAAEMLLRNLRHNGCVDEFLQDQFNHLIRHLATGTSRDTNRRRLPRTRRRRSTLQSNLL